MKKRKTAAPPIAAPAMPPGESVAGDEEAAVVGDEDVDEVVVEAEADVVAAEEVGGASESILVRKPEMARGFCQLVYEMSYFGVVQTHEFMDVGKREEAARQRGQRFRLRTAEEAREGKGPM
ncbi:hypothetical protein M7I_3470 [Glarea lozoyensis 74030]|uniref:Uncharacterized protein n=1 Tax=Glarea lozoyensis (strain ATCC 74030 / MF5533) TaxID=1104152 RepID=H0ELK6_GLAL7|nr:hypothetical protein M7I_3470 [Glarea lozoyensis 74030]